MLKYFLLSIIMCIFTYNKLKPNNMKIIIIYWILTTIYGVYWLIKNPTERHGYDTNDFTLMEVIAYIFPAAAFGWIFVPIMILNKIKFKR